MNQESRQFRDNIKANGMNIFLSIKASFYCLISCSAGEIAGKTISYLSGINHIYSSFITISLAFITGVSWGTLRHKKQGHTNSRAFNEAVKGEWLSIMTMECVIILTETVLGNAHTVPVAAAGLTASFFIVLPVNYLLIKNGIRHEHI